MTKKWEDRPAICVISWDGVLSTHSPLNIRKKKEKEKKKKARRGDWREVTRQ